MLKQKKGANPVDRYVGNRVRMRRLMLSMSQELLGQKLGLTFQQVQKYAALGQLRHADLAD